MNQDASTEVRASTTGFATFRWVALAAVVVATVAGAFVYWRHVELYPSNRERLYRIEHRPRGLGGERPGDPRLCADRRPREGRRSRCSTSIRRSMTRRCATPAPSSMLPPTPPEPPATISKRQRPRSEQKRTALEAALKTYQDAKDAQAQDAPPSEQLNAAESAWQDALKAYKDAEDAFAAEQDKSLTVTTPTTQLRAASAQLSKATHDRVKTHTTAPSDGILSNVTLRPGATVQAGQPLFAIIEANRWWVDANFKETDLARIKVGQPATVYLDMYPGVTFDGDGGEHQLRAQARASPCCRRKTRAATG